MKFDNPTNTTYPCNCIGPQNGEPMCPCQMRSIKIRDGRYIKPEVDLGPVVKAGTTTYAAPKPEDV